jgi:integrase
MEVKARRMKLGSYPSMTIKDAREVARSHLLRVALGEDPMGQREKANTEATIDQLWAECEKTVYNRGKDWDREAKRLYEKRLKPKLGKFRCTAVTYARVKEVRDGLRDIPIEANRALAVLSRMLKEALRLEWRKADAGNPCLLVERYPERKRTRYASPEELELIGKALDKRIASDLSGVAFLYLLLYSGARPSEIENGKPDQVKRKVVDGHVVGVLRLKGKTSDETGEERAVFLPPQAMRVLDMLPPEREHLAGRKRLPRRLWAEVRDEVGCPDLWARDSRRTFASVAFSEDISIHQVGELLGHASIQTTKIYAKLMEKKAHAAAAKTAGLMAGMLNGGERK